MRAALVAISVAIPVPAIAQDSNASPITVLSASICELVAQPQRFNGEIVRVRAQYESDGIHLSVLVDPRCAGVGVVPQGHTGSAVDAERGGCKGTLGKQIIATWLGWYHWDPNKTPGTDVPRWLDVVEIENLEVKPKAFPLVVRCPR